MCEDKKYVQKEKIYKEADFVRRTDEQAYKRFIGNKTEAANLKFQGIKKIIKLINRKSAIKNF